MDSNRQSGRSIRRWTRLEIHWQRRYSPPCKPQEKHADPYQQYQARTPTQSSPTTPSQPASNASTTKSQSPRTSAKTPTCSTPSASPRSLPTSTECQAGSTPLRPVGASTATMAVSTQTIIPIQGIMPSRMGRALRLVVALFIRMVLMGVFFIRGMGCRWGLRLIRVSGGDCIRLWVCRTWRR